MPGCSACTMGADSSSPVAGKVRRTPHRIRLRPTRASGPASHRPEWDEVRVLVHSRARSTPATEPHEPPRIPVQAAVRPVRDSRAERLRRRHAGGGRRRGQAPRRLGLGRQGPGARGRARQGGRRQGRQVEGGRGGGRGRHARPAAQDQADGRRRPADQPGLRRVRFEDRARAVPEPAAQPRHEQDRVRRLGRGRHGHRGSRGEDAGEDHPRRDPPGRRACRARTAARSRSGSASRASRSRSSSRSRAACTSSTSNATRASSRSIR